MKSIYALKDPETGEIKYVGATNNIHKRYQRHCYRDKKPKGPKSLWCNSLINKGLKPILVVLDAEPENWGLAEDYWIKKHIDTVLNSQSGGNHKGSTQFDEYKRRIGNGNIGKKRTPEQIKRLSEAHKHQRPSPEQVKRTADKLRGKKRPAYVGEKISKSLTGRKLSNDHVEKIRKNNIGTKRSSNTKLKMSGSQKARRLVEEKVICIGDECHTLTEWSGLSGETRKNIQQRMYRGYSLKQSMYGGNLRNIKPDRRQP